MQDLKRPRAFNTSRGAAVRVICKFVGLSVGNSDFTETVHTFHHHHFFVWSMRIILRYVIMVNFSLSSPFRALLNWVLANISDGRSFLIVVSRFAFVVVVNPTVKVFQWVKSTQVSFQTLQYDRCRHLKFNCWSHTFIFPECSWSWCLSLHLSHCHFSIRTHTHTHALCFSTVLLLSR